MLQLYQAEWCPFSAAVRERLTELGLDFVARQVEPWPEQRVSLAELAGTDQIPVLEDEGTFYVGTRAIFGDLDALGQGEHAAGHRARYHEHGPARVRDVAAWLLDRSTPV
jgi:glutathione S-transferase